MTDDPAMDEVGLDPAATSREARLEAALADYYTSVDEGRKPDRAAFLARYPDLSDELEKIFASEVFVERLEGRFREAGGAGPVLPIAAGGRLGDYEILGEIAHGGMGVVYRARQRSLGRTVALKVVLTGEFASDEERRRFRREAETAAALDHPSIVPVYEVGEQGGLCYLAMKLIEGKSLGEFEVPAGDRYRFGARVVERIARAIHHAHLTGVIHRDLKPANILMDRSGEPHVVDFGLARLQNHSGTLTRTGALLGTLRYMAPEQAGGEETDAGPTVDVYGLGAILYQLLVGVPPFSTGSSVLLLKQVLQDEPQHPAFHDPAVPRDLVTICLKCLHKNPRRRYQTADEVAGDLGRFLENRPIKARPTGLLERSVKWARRRPARLAAITLLIALAALLIALRFDFVRRELTDRISSHERHASRLSHAYEGVTAREFSSARELLHERGSNEEGEDLRGFGWYLLWRLAHVDRATQRLPESETCWVRFTPDNHGVAVGSTTEITVWNVSELAGARMVEPRWVTDPRSGRLQDFGFSPNGKFLAVADIFHERVFVVDVGAKKEILRPQGRFLAWCLDTLVTLERDGKLTVSDIPTGNVRKLTTSSPVHGGFCASRDRAVAAVVGEDGVLETWDLVSGTLSGRCSLRGAHTDCFGEWMALSPDGSVVACAHRDGRVTLRGTTHGEEFRELPGHRGPVRCVAFSADGERLASGGDDGSVRVWDTKTGTVEAVLLGHEGSVGAVAFDRERKLVASASTVDRSLKLWDITKRHAVDPRPSERILTTDHIIRTIVCTTDGDTVIVGEVYDDDAIHVVDIGTSSGLEPRRLESIPAEDLGDYYHGASSPDGELHVAIRPDHQVVVMQFTRSGDSVSFDDPVPAGRHATKVTSLGFSPRGNLLATCDDDRRLKLWRRQGSGPKFELAKEMVATCDGIDMVFSPLGRYLAMSCTDGHVFLVDIENGYETHRLTGSDDGSSIGAVLFCPKARLLATGGRDGVVRIWDLGGRRAGEPPEERMRCSGHVGGVFSLAFTPDGRRLASGGADKTIKIWDVTVVPRTGRALRCLTLRGHEGEVTALAFTPDGRTLLSGGDLQTGKHEVRLWRGASDEEIRAYRRD